MVKIVNFVLYIFYKTIKTIIKLQRGNKVIQKIPAHSKSNSKVGKGSKKQGEGNLFS